MSRYGFTVKPLPAFVPLLPVSRYGRPKTHSLSFVTADLMVG
jgi:hypothetical protein